MKFYLIREETYKVSIVEVLAEDEAAFLEAHKGEIVGQSAASLAELLQRMVDGLEDL